MLNEMASLPDYLKMPVPMLNENERKTSPMRPHPPMVASVGVGSILGPYRLLSELGSGGMATVYRAEPARNVDHTDLGIIDAQIAVKVLHEHLAREREHVEAFLDEGRIGARLHHPAVCQVFDHGEERGRPYVAMELIDGVSLESLHANLAIRPELAQGAEWPRQIAALVAALADGLHAAHELTAPDGMPLGLVHRDVTPENLYVTTCGGVRLADFGVARHAARRHLTREGVIKGKLAYAAPELFHGATPDRRIDVWSLGVVLWELLTGEMLFRLPTDAETTRAILDRELPAPSRFRASVRRTLDLIVLQALERNPERRFANARAFANALRGWLAATGGEIRAPARRDWLVDLAVTVTRADLC
jgi:serine/threonine protein kinase